jgi:hypothetical protein
MSDHEADRKWEIRRVSWGSDPRIELLLYDDGWEPFAVLGVDLNREVWYRRWTTSLAPSRPTFKDGDLVGIEVAGDE